MTSSDEAYSWTQDQVVTTLTFLQGKTPEEVAETLWGREEGSVRRLGEVDPYTTETVRGHSAHRVLLAAERGWTVLIEPNGCAGVHASLAGRLSRGARLVALYRSVNADMTFLNANNGVVTRRFDPLQFPDEQAGEPLPEEAGLTFGWDEEEDRAGRTPDPYRQAVMLVERLTGLMLTTDWLFETPRPVYLMPTDSAVAARA